MTRVVISNERLYKRLNAHLQMKVPAEGKLILQNSSNIKSLESQRYVRCLATRPVEIRERMQSDLSSTYTITDMDILK